MAIVLAEIRLSQETIVSELNVAYLQTQGPTDADTSVAAAKAIGDAWKTGLVDLLSNQVTYESVKTWVVDAGPFPTRIANRNNETGAVSQNALQANMTLIVNFRNDAGELKRPGRVQCSGIPVTYLVDGVIGPANVNTIETALNNNVLTVTTGDPQLFTGRLVVARPTRVQGQPTTWETFIINRCQVPQALGSRLERKGRKLGRPG